MNPETGGHSHLWPDVFSLREKVALVTGGSRGIGYMIAEGFLAAGARVYICSRREEAVQEAAKRLAGLGECHAVTCDLSEEQGIATLCQHLESAERELHILVNNAGTTWGAPLDEYPMRAFHKVLGLNVISLFELTRRLLPLLRQAARADDPARIINVGSVDGLAVPASENYAYSASKAAVHMLTRHLARRLLPENITVNAIAPGVFETRMTAHWFDSAHPASDTRPEIPMARPGRPEEIAAAAVYLSARSGSYLTGVTLPVSGGLGTV
jgi:NAD(P)-dependent dehydrogenase (short-subunit alcohol dehydrogenase family)